MRVILTGFCRSGTTSTAQFYSLFGVPSHHQKLGPGRANMRPYDYADPPAWAHNYMDRKAAAINSSDGFEASWEVAHFIYLLSQRCPQVFWLLMLRDPAAACNSLRKYNRKGTEIADLAALYEETMLGILEQCLMMTSRPRWLDFERYIAGGYTGALLDLFGIPLTMDNRELAAGHLGRKVRSSGEYAVQDYGLNVGPKKRRESIFANGRHIVRILKTVCKELT